MGVAAKLLISMAAKMKKEKLAKIIVVVISIPAMLLVIFLNVFVVKSTYEDDVYLIAAKSVKEQLKTSNKIDGNLVKAIYFIFSERNEGQTEDQIEIENFIKDYFVNTFVDFYFADDGTVVEYKYHVFKSYGEIMLMLTMPPFQYNAHEMTLINLYLMFPSDDMGDITLPGTGDGAITGDDLGDIGDNDGTKPDILPIRLSPPCSGRITSYYGMRTHPVTGEKLSFHTGIDIAGTHHQPIMAVADGVVVSVNRSSSGYGNYVMIEHKSGDLTFYSFYAHLSSISATMGQNVSAGTVIALEGGQPGVDPNPGASTGHHLHFELRLTRSNTSCFDPAPYL